MSIANILLEITGTSADARKELAATARDLAGLDRADAEATVDVNTEPAKRGLKAIRAELVAWAKSRADARAGLDVNDARAGFAEIGAELAAWSREVADATADVDTEKGHAAVAALRARLAEFDHVDVDAQTHVQIAKAMTEIAVLEAALEAIDNKDVVVDVKLRRGIVNQLGSMSKLFSSFPDMPSAPTGFFGKIGESLSGLSMNLGPFSGGLSKMGAILAALIPIIVSFGGALTAMSTSLGAALAGLLAALTAIIASLTSAIGAVGALGVAFGALLLPNALLALGVIDRFKAQSEKAGTAAYALRGAGEDLAKTFNRTLAPAADAVMAGLAAGLPKITKMIEGAGGFFTNLGKAGGDALKSILDELSNAAWQEWFRMVTSAATQAVPSLTSAFLSFGEIMRNISTAAMPLLLDALESFAAWLGDIANKTGNIGGLRDAISAMAGDLNQWIGLFSSIGRLIGSVFGGAIGKGREFVGTITDTINGWADFLSTTEGKNAISDFIDTTMEHLSSWVNLLGNIGGVFKGLFKSMGGEGKGFVDSLADGAGRLAEWLTSAEGIEAIKKFFEETKPLVAAVASALGKGIVAVIRFGQAFAPVLAPIIRGVGDLLDVLNFLLGLILKIPAPIRGLIGTIAAFVLGWGKFKAAGMVARAVLYLLIGALGALGGAFGVAWNAIKTAGSAIWSFTKRVWNAVANWVSNAAKDVRKSVSSGWAAVRTKTTEVWNAVRAKTSAVWNAIKAKIAQVVGAIAGVIRGAKQAIVGAAEAVWDGVKGKFTTLRNVAKRAFDKAKEGIDAAKDAIVAAAKKVWEAVKKVIMAPISFVINEPKKKLNNDASKGVGSVAGGGRKPSSAPLSGLSNALANALPRVGGAPSTGAAANAIANSGATTTQNFIINSPAGTIADPNVVAAQLGVLLRQRGALA